MDPIAQKNPPLKSRVSTDPGPAQEDGRNAFFRKGSVKLSYHLREDYRFEKKHKQLLAIARAKCGSSGASAMACVTG
jgi:hypothetical protein